MRFFLFALLFSSKLFSQSLSPERVQRIKDATVQITIEGSKWTGTGFFYTSSGHLLTCWHVADSAVGFFNGVMRQIRKIYILFKDGQKAEVEIPDNIFIIKKTLESAVLNDFCPLIPKDQLTIKHSFLELGIYDSASEGDQVVTCGYPLGYPQQFISVGILSTKYSDNPGRYVNDLGDTIKPNRNVSLLDMTMNHGNSGGAIVRLGKTPKDDKVIGIADFIINPFSGQADSLVQFLNSRPGGVLIEGVDPIKTLAQLTIFLNNVSIGVSGCVSIQYASQYSNAATGIAAFSFNT